MKCVADLVIKPAVFLDRDGVLTRENSYITSIDNLEIYSYAADCIERIHEKGYLAIVITNQSGIARGLFSETELLKMNDYLVEQTGVDAVYYCPHLPNGKIEKYKKECNCRKPQIGMLKRACEDFNIDMANSFFVGDRATDIETGMNAGISTVLVKTGYGVERLEKDVNPTYIMNDLSEFIKILY